MKKFLAMVLGISFALSITAQIPQGFNYQAVIRDGEGQPLSQQAVNLRVSLQNEGGTITHYAETHSTITTSQGQVSLVVGGGTVVSGVFADIPWNEGNIFIKVEIDPTGGTTYSPLGTTKLNAVPYALFAADGNQGPQGDPGVGLLFSWQGTFLGVKREDDNDFTFTNLKGDQGLNGVSIEWLGSFEAHPTIPAPTLNQAYYNTVQKRSYIFNGVQWRVMTYDGATGPQGPAGTGLYNRGEWETGTTYNPGDYVFDCSDEACQTNSMWIVEAASSFESNTNPYLDPDHWIQFQAPAGQDGENGIDGLDGKTVLNGIIDPSVGIGSDGDFYINTTTNRIFGPKAGGVWPTPGVSLVGPTGPEGPMVNGTAGQALVHNGTGWAATSNIFTDGSSRVGVGTTAPSEKLDVDGNIRARGKLIAEGVEIESADPLQDEPIFVVRNNAGQIVFAVYETGVRMYVDDAATGPKADKAGFAIGGLTGQKGLDDVNEYFRVTPDSVRIYLRETDKTNKAGFAIGGLTGPKQESDEYLRVTRSSTRISIDTEATEKADKAGFAIGGLTGQKGGREFLRVTRDSTRVYFDETSTEKTNKAGFAIGGLTGPKQESDEYLRVTRGSTRISIDADAVDKADKAGFAIGGLTGQKGGQEFLRVTRDSTRVYINDTLTGKTNKGGFAIGGLTGQKTGNSSNFFNITPDTSATIEPSEARILWYPSKNAFLTGQVLIEKPDSVGKNSFSSGFESKAIGNFSQALGYMARAKGVNSTAIGNGANAEAENSFAFGDFANATGQGSYAIGSVGRDSLGNAAGDPTNAFGNFSFAIGLGARADSTNAFALGGKTRAQGVGAFAFGFESWASQRYSIAGGFNSRAYGRSAVALGEDNWANRFSVAIGASNWVEGVNSIGIGTFNDFNSKPNSVMIGSGNVTDLNNTYAFGENNFIDDNFDPTRHHAMAIGFGNEINNTGAFGIGNSVTSSGQYSFAIGTGSTASGNYSTSIGHNIITSGDHSFGIALNNQVGTTVSQANTMAIMGGKVGIGTTTPAYTLEVAGDIRSSNKIWAGANGASYFRGGDDSELWDVNVANTLAIYGVQNPAVATLRLGSGAADISGSAGNVGIGTNTPAVKLDVNGGMALRQTTPSSTTGNVYGWNLGEGSYFRVSSTTDDLIGGIAGGTDGKVIILTNIGSYKLTFLHNNVGGSGDPVNKLISSTSTSIELYPNHTLTLIYDSISQCWRDIAFR